MLAHGSPDPRHARDIDHLVCRVAALAPHLRPRVASLDHHRPTIGDAAAALKGGAGPIVVVPALVTRAYHARVDVPTAAGELATRSGRRVITTDSLGPHPLLAVGVGELVAGHAGDVIIFLGGSTQPGAIEEVVDVLSAYLPAIRRYAFATLDGRLPLQEAIDDLAGPADVTAVGAVLADGVLRDRMARQCAAYGIELVPGVLARTEAIARLVLARVDAQEQRKSPSGG